MDIWTMFFKGLGLGVVIATTFGPMKVLCLRRTLTYGPSVGVSFALGVASGDAIYAMLAGFGVTLISQILMEHYGILRLCGGSLLIYLGYKAITKSANPTNRDAMSKTRVTRLRTYGEAVGLTLSSPLTILIFATVLLGVDVGSSSKTTGLLVTGIAAGSLLVYSAFICAVSMIGRHLSAVTIVWVNRTAGSVLVAYGLFAVWIGVAALGLSQTP